MSELKKGFYLVTADGLNTMLRWDGEAWVDMRGIRPCFKKVMWTSYCGENNPVFEQPRTWVGLTDGESVAIELSLRIPTGYQDDYDLSLRDFSKAIEAKLKEKNT